MLKMGQMCQCKSTLWKIDASTGEIVARADRGDLTVGLAAYDDGTDIYLYESGFITPAPYNIVKWKDAGDRFTKVWEVSPTSAGNASPLAYASDNKLWAGNLFRLNDSDGSTANSASVANNPHYIVPGDSGTVFVSGFGSAHYPSGSTLALVSTSVVATTTISSLQPGRCRLANSWFVGVNASPRLIREYDDTLTLIASANAPLASGTNRLYPAQRYSDDGKVFCAEMTSVGGTVLNWQRIDVTGLSSDWSITAPSSVDIEPVGLTADGDVYVLCVGDAIYRLSGVDGSVVWSTAVGTTGTGLGGWCYYLIREGGLLLVVLAASSGKLMTLSGSSVTAMALDYTDGTVVWARGLEGAGRFIGGPHVVDGHLYVAGTRQIRAIQPDLVP